MPLSRGNTVFMRFPLIYKSPLVISSNPAIILSVVDFPHPEGPTNAINSPFSIERLKSVTEFFSAPAYLLHTFFISIKLIV